MIIRMDYYTVKCDNCGELYEDEHQGISAWNEADYAQENASESGWAKDDDKHYCPDCYEYDDDDNLVVKPNNN